MRWRNIEETHMSVDRQTSLADRIRMQGRESL